ncbi:hypothetical protein HPB51_027379 [Rhipicephalus microplus]|uniref:Regulatory protein zeste n=1 Tax=Rhipicephalus microplus TaxID=6941 RepID=A0A9J6D0L1_RHIMP|nr:hypothetical protein HPB51_027379 [Rhipicephalus microplus]
MQKPRHGKKLCTDFNCRPFVRPRDVKQLKKLWDNMKQRWKREKAKQIRDVLTTDQTEELSQTDRAAMQSMLQSSHTPSVVGEDSLCLDDPKVDADMSQEEAAQPGAQSEAPTAGSSVRNVRGGRLSLLQHTLDVELEARLDAIKADKKHKQIEHNQRMECMREEHEIKISALKEQKKNCNIQHKIKLRILKKEEVQKLKQALLRKQLQASRL